MVLFTKLLTQAILLLPMQQILSMVLFTKLLTKDIIKAKANGF